MKIDATGFAGEVRKAYDTFRYWDREVEIYESEVKRYPGSSLAKSHLRDMRISRESSLDRLRALVPTLEARIAEE